MYNEAQQRPILNMAEDAFDLPRGLLYGLMMQESGGRPRPGPTADNAGRPLKERAQGYFQFMPSTAKDLGVTLGDFSSEAFGAGRYLRQLWDRRGSLEAALAAYGGHVTADPAPYIQGVKVKAGVQADGDDVDLSFLWNRGDKPAKPADKPADTGDDVDLGFLFNRPPAKAPAEPAKALQPVETIEPSQPDGQAPAEAAEAPVLDFPELTPITPREKTAREAELEGVDDTGQLVGEIGGGFAGALAGAVAGSLLGPVGIVVGGILGSMAGAAGGSALGTQFDIEKANERGVEISADEAEKLIRDNAVEALVYDAAGNVVFLGLGKVFNLVRNSPKLVALARRYKVKTRKVDPLPTTSRHFDDAQHAANLVRPEGLTDEAWEAAKKKSLGDSAAKQADLTEDAAKLLSDAPGKGVVTKGAVSGTDGWVEGAAKTLDPAAFRRNQEALRQKAQDAADQFLADVARVGNEPQRLGKVVTESLEAVERTMKDQTGPIFARARGLAGTVDTKPAARITDDLLRRNDAVGGVKLSVGDSGELGLLKRVSERLNSGEPLSIEDAMELASSLKARLRSTDPIAAPSAEVRKVLTDVVRALDGSLDDAIGKVADPALQAELKAAKELYRETMQAVYSDGTKALIRANPEDVGKRLFHAGNVTEIQDLAAVIKLQMKTDPAAAQRTARLVLRSFYDEMTPTLERIASFGENLKAQPDLRRTWVALVEVAKAAGIPRPEFPVIERMAQLALKNPSVDNVGKWVVRGLASAGGMGVLGPLGGPVGYVAMAVVSKALSRLALRKPAQATKLAQLMSVAMKMAAGFTASEVLVRALTEIDGIAQEEGLGSIFLTGEGSADSTNKN